MECVQLRKISTRKRNLERIIKCISPDREGLVYHVEVKHGYEK